MPQAPILARCNKRILEVRTGLTVVQRPLSLHVHVPHLVKSHQLINGPSSDAHFTVEDGGRSGRFSPLVSGIPPGGVDSMFRLKDVDAVAHSCNMTNLRDW